MSFDAERVESILKTVPSRYRGPGGAIAVLKDGELVGQHTWGYADMNQRIPMSSRVLFPICSITKQFASMLLVDLAANPPTAVTQSQGSFQEQMVARLREIVPREFVDEAGLTIDNLVDMHSGLRDYWALCTLQGSRPETPYLLHEHNHDMLRWSKTLHFQPGTEYSYSNTNFNIVERLLEHVTQDSLDNLLAERIFGPAKMTTARLTPRTDRLPPPIIGYEGTEKFGFFPADNFIEWSADAGLGASLEDMIAYEKYFDKRFIDPQDNYREVIKSRKRKDGTVARYRYGLGDASLEGFPAVGHGGALRGFKLHRRYLEDQRMSVVVLFNHSASAGEAAEYIIKQVLNIPTAPESTISPVGDWFGSFLDQDTQLSIRVEPGKTGKIKIAYVRAQETLKLVTANTAASRSIEARIDQDTLQVRRLDDNRVLNAKRLAKGTDMPTASPFRGTYQCSEIGSTFICAGEGEMLYGLFTGYFGHGPPHLMTYLGDDVWILADPRAMDDQPPGDWTLVFSRSEHGDVNAVTIGCWLARKLEFVRTA